MAKFKCKGEDIKPFVKAMAVLGKDVTDIRLESNGSMLQGSAIPSSHSALIMVKMNLEGLLTEDMTDFAAAVDMRHFKTLTDLAGPEDELMIVMDLGRFNIRIGQHIQRSFPLLGEIPKPLDPKVIPPFTFEVPVETLKPMIKALNLDDPYTDIYIRMLDTGLMFSTETYGGDSRSSYSIPMDKIVGGDLAERFEVRYPFKDFVTLKDLPAEGNMTFRSGEKMPLEVLASIGRLSVRAMYAPVLPKEG